MSQINVDLIRSLTGQKIKAMRLRRNLTQKQVANFVGMTKPVIINVERGKQNLTTYSCMAFCLFFGCTPNDLYPTMDEYKNKLTKL